MDRIAFQTNRTFFPSSHPKEKHLTFHDFARLSTGYLKNSPYTLISTKKPYDFGCTTPNSEIAVAHSAFWDLGPLKIIQQKNPELLGSSWFELF